MVRKVVLLLLFSAIFSCDGKKVVDLPNPSGKELFTAIPHEYSGINFINKVENKDRFNIFKDRNFYNGSGVALGDVNNDGLLDIYFASNQSYNKLYINRGDFVFEDMTKYAKVGGYSGAWSTGVTMIDINNDGFLDIYISNSGSIEKGSRRNQLFINDGDGTFKEKSGTYGFSGNHFGVQAALLDYDEDGDMDIYQLNNSPYPISGFDFSEKQRAQIDKKSNLPGKAKGGGDEIYKKDGERYVDYGMSFGIYRASMGFGMGLAVADFNGDSRSDIYVCNDFQEPDYLYINKGKGKFENQIERRLPHTGRYSRGVDVGDVNNDGFLDIFTLDRLPADDERFKRLVDWNSDPLGRGERFKYQQMRNTLQINLGNGYFSDVAPALGVAATDWSWGSLIADFDNDGRKDIFVTNGSYYDITDGDFRQFFAKKDIQKRVSLGNKENLEDILSVLKSTPLSNYMFHNDTDGNFSDKAADWGLDTPGFSTGAAYGDLDNDGDLDLVVNNIDQHASIYRNNTESLNPDNHYIKLKFYGSDNNIFGIGAVVRVYTGDGIITHLQNPCRGYMSSVDYTATIGIGQKAIDSLNVIWMDGKAQTLKHIAIDRITSLRYKDAKKRSPKRSPEKMFISLSVTKNFTAVKDDHNQTTQDELRYCDMSMEGPASALSDVNGDGLMDIFLGGPKGQSGKVYLQTKSGNFEVNATKDFLGHRSYEDTAAVFFDANGDHHIDLAVASGGNFDRGNYPIRIYTNDGKRFNAMSKMLDFDANASVLLPFDADGDGDKDLLVAGRSIPQRYGESPTHKILENDGKGNFEISNVGLLSLLKDVGMVVSGEMSDINGDGVAEILLLEDWGTLRILKRKDDRWQFLDTNLSKYKGWWRSLKVVDLNADGKKDLILGNLGNNTFYHPSPESPLKLFIRDFNDDGKVDRLITHTVDGKDKPVFTKSDMELQIPDIAPSYEIYARSSMSDLFPDIDESSAKVVNTSASYIAINIGNGRFDIKQLPGEAQLSSIEAIDTFDFNDDGNIDILFAGNNTRLMHQYGRLDNGIGGVLLGDGKGDFKVLSHKDSGIVIKGETSAVHAFRNAKNNCMILAIIRDGWPKLFVKK